jgi:glycosyltransferase involved in cell wall biosynthesis
MKNLRIGIFIDGTFIPERDGASTRFANLPRHLSNLGIGIVVFHCYRGWSQLDLISREPYPTYFFKPENYYSNLSLIRNLLLKEHIDIIQMNDLETMHRLGFPLAKDLGVYLIYEALYHSSTLAKQIGPSSKEIALIKRLEHEASRYSDEIITFTNEDRLRWMKFSNCKEERVSIVHFGVNIDSNILPITDREPYLLFLGNMYFEPNSRALKRIIYEIYPTVKSQYPKAKCLIIGDVPNSERELCKKEGLELTSEVPDIKPWLYKCKAGLAPIFEGSGVRVKILNYLACGIPVVSTSVAAEGLNFPALFVEDDIKSFSFLCANILRQSKSLEQAICDTLKILKSNYIWEKIACESLNVYEKVLTRSQNKRPNNLISLCSLPMWLNEVIRKGRFPEARDLVDIKYQYGVATEGKVEFYY